MFLYSEYFMYIIQGVGHLKYYKLLSLKIRIIAKDVLDTSYLA